MNKVRMIMLVLFVASAATGLIGCSPAEDNSGAPTKAEIDKGLEGKPAIDPKNSAPMSPSQGKKGP